MLYLLLADTLVVLHLAFVLFVVLGGFLLFRWPRVVWLHVPAAVWGALIEVFGWVCPLTPLEVRLRRLGGEAGYEGGFIEHYLLPILYPSGLTRTHQVVLGIIVVAVNAGVYGWWLGTRRRNRGSGGAAASDSGGDGG